MDVDIPCKTHISKNRLKINNILQNGAIRDESLCIIKNQFCSLYKCL